MSLRVRELTPPGSGAIAVIELNGAGAAERLVTLGVTPPALASPRLVRLTQDGEPLDEGLCIARGEEHFELHLHGSPAVVRRVVGALSGEPFSMPASIEERAAEAMGRARSEAAARLLLDQSEGALRRGLEELNTRVEDEARFGAQLEVLLERGRVAGHLLRPPRVVLAGPTNAGKSTLFNLLVGAERVVVDGAPGTTRDAVFEGARLGAFAVELGDLAGAREIGGEGAEEIAPADQIEARGQAAGVAWARASDLVFWVSPVVAPEAPSPALRGESEGGRVRVVQSRADESPGHPSVAVGDCAEVGPCFSVHADPAGAREVIEALFHEALDLPREPWSPGAAVPFAAPELEVLRGLAREPSAAGRRAALQSLLAR